MTEVDETIDAPSIVFFIGLGRMGFMKIHSYSLGEIEIGKEAIIRFKTGLPGFEQLKRFVLLDLEEEAPFKCLQSVDEEDAAFVVVNPFLFYPDYEFQLPSTVQEELEITREEDVEVWCIVTIHCSVEETTLNLLAPVILNKIGRWGKQIVLHDTVYRTKHKLLHTIPDAPGSEG